MTDHCHAALLPLNTGNGAFFLIFWSALSLAAAEAPPLLFQEVRALLAWWLQSFVSCILSVMGVFAICVRAGPVGPEKIGWRQHSSFRHLLTACVLPCINAT